MVEANEQPFEVVLSGLLDFRAFDPNVFERQAPPFDEIGDVVAERRHILEDVFFGLFKRHEDAALAAGRGMNEEFEREHRLATTGTAAYERRPAFGQAAAGDLIEAGDSGGDLLER